MTWRTHLAGGIVAGASLSLLLSPPDAGMPGLILLGAAFGSLLPDLDAADAKIHHAVRVFGIEPFTLPAAVIHRTLGHRGAFHSLAAVTAVAFVAALGSTALGLPPDVVTLGTASVSLGFLSHLLLDACTPHGVPLFLPFRRGRRHVLPRQYWVATGSESEDVVFVLLATLGLVLLLIPMPTL